MIRCPVCSSEVEAAARLVRCEGCIWEDRKAASEARRRLGALRKGVGEVAYGRDGCGVCERCRAHFEANAALCPLVLFYNAARGDRLVEPDAEPDRFPIEVEEYWLTCLDDRGYPEHVEAYWRRLTQELKEPEGV